MQMGQYREAAEHLLVSLGVQQDNVAQVLTKASHNISSQDWMMHASQSESLWKALRVLMDTYSNLHFFYQLKSASSST